MNQSGKTSGSTQVESWYVATESGAVEYGIDALRLDIERGRVHDKSLVWRKGMQNWVELDRVPLLRMLVAVDAHPVINSSSKLDTHATAPTSTAIFDDLFEEKTALFVRQDPVAATRAPLTRPPTPRISIPGVLTAPASKTSPLRTEGHFPIPAPPPLRVAVLPSPTQTQEDCPKALQTRAEPRSPIPTPPPLLAEAAMPNAKAPTLATQLVPPSAEQQAASKDAPEELSESNDAHAKRVIEDEQPALKALTALTQASGQATISSAPLAGSRLSLGRADAPCTSGANPSSRVPSVPTDLPAPRAAEVPLPAASAGISGHASSKASFDSRAVSEPAMAKDALSDSIYPSISSIQPGLLRAHPSKRTLIIAAGLTVAAAAGILVATTVTPSEKAPATAIDHSDTAGARERNAHVDRAPAAARATEAPSEPKPADAVVETPATKRAKAEPVESAPAPSRTARTAKKTSNGASIASPTSPRASGSAATGKPKPGEPPTANGDESVAAWEQGPIEKRPWMAPGF